MIDVGCTADEKFHYIDVAILRCNKQRSCTILLRCTMWLNDADDDEVSNEKQRYIDFDIDDDDNDENDDDEDD